MSLITRILKNMTLAVTLLTVICFSAVSVAETSPVADRERQSRDVARLIRESRENLYSNPKEASSLANRALKLCDMSHPDTACREATILYADAEQLLGNFDLSIRVLYDAEALVDTTDTRTRARLFALEGRVFSKLGDYTRSVELNDKATSMFKALGDSASVAHCYTERGVTLLNTNEFVLAEHFFRRSLEISRKLGNFQSIARNLNNMCLYPGNSEEKLEMIDEAITINRHLDSKWALGENYNNKGKQLIYAGRGREAKAALAKALEYIRQIEARELLCDYYEYSAMADALLGDYKSAYENMERMTVLVSELQRRNRQRNTELDISRKRDDDMSRAAELQAREYQIKLLHRNLWILGAAIVLVVVCGLFYYKWYRHRKNLQLLHTRHDLDLAAKELDSLKLRQQELELENARNMLSASRRDLTGFAAFLKSRNEMMDKVRDMIKEAYRMEADKVAPHLKKVNAFIGSYVSHDTSSQTLLLRAEECNKDFMNALITRHPDLTKGERNLALLIRGGMSTKEISLLLGLETKTVNMNRYRLRKSLGLPTDTDLQDYISGI